jgi:ElaB/YqjD/DUF883 family membrane-anchored ribosome-binding protein
MAQYDLSNDPRVGSRDLADKAMEVGVRAADTLGRAVGTVQETGDQLAAQGAELSENLQKVANNFSKALNKSVAEQPMTTLGVAVAAGFVLGAIWKA